MRNWLTILGALAALFAFVALDGGRGVCPARIAIGSSLVVAGCP